MIVGLNVLNYVVMGNQSGDMDSSSSAIAVAAAYSAFPLLNIPKEDLPLRKDLLFVLEKVKINPADLFFKEDIPSFLQQAQAGGLKWILVDHNVLAPGQEPIAPFVERIIDHHRDESGHCQDKTIAQVASTATLVTEWISQAHPEVLNSTIALLLAAAILLDTSHFQDLRKTTMRDREAFAILSAIEPKVAEPSFYDQLLAKRTEVDSHRPDLILRKDFKLYKESSFLYGISSLPHGITVTLEEALEWKEALQGILSGHNALFWIVLEWVGVEKAVLFYAPTESLKKALYSHLSQKSELVDVASLQTKESFLFCKLREPLARKFFQPLFDFKY